jgi:hypothetical protein
MQHLHRSPTRRIIMEATAKVAKQMVGFQKTVFENSFNTMNVVQDQTESMLNNFIGQFPWVTEDGKKQMNETFSNSLHRMIFLEDDYV